MPGAATLQVNVAPSDHQVAAHTLPHQLRQLGDQVNEVLYVYDTRRPSRRSRFAAGWEQHRPHVEALLKDLAAADPRVRIEAVDYGDERRRHVAQRYFGRDDIPLKDSRGAPFHAYFYGLDTARNDVVLHLDADMLLGGAGAGWVQEAVAHLRASPDVVFTAPLPGPPLSRGGDGAPVPSPDQELSTRAFLVDRTRLVDRLAPISLDVALPGRKLLKAIVQGNPHQPPAEMVLSEALRRSGSRRTDLLGTAPGLWSLHPPYRSDRFTAALASIVARVEAGDMPDGQRGTHDVNQALFDWAGEGRLFHLRRLWGY